MTYSSNALFGPALPLCIKYGSKWQSEHNSGIFTFWPGPRNRSYWGTFNHLFSDTGYTGSESEITDFTWRKTGLIIPYWLADRFFDGLK